MCRLMRQLRGQEQSSAPTSELQERNQEHSSRERSSRERSPRERSPREELSQSARSTVPFGPSTREELQLRQSVSSEEL